MSQLTERMIRAARLDTTLYEEVEADRGAIGQAMAAVIVSSAAAGVGSFPAGGITALFLSLTGALAGWFLWAFIMYIIGTRLLPEPETKSDFGELLRTTGFASSPGVLRIVSALPLLGGIVSLIASAWMLVAMIVAVRQALDYSSTGRAIAVCVIGFIANAIAFFLIAVAPILLAGRAAGA